MLEELKARHPSVGDVRSIGLFGIVELVKDRKTLEPLAPFNGTSPEMQALGKFFREEGLYTFVRWNSFFTNPPLCITEAELAEAFAIIDNPPACGLAGRPPPPLRLGTRGTATAQFVRPLPGLRSAVHRDGAQLEGRLVGINGARAWPSPPVRVACGDIRGD